MEKSAFYLKKALKHLERYIDENFPNNTEKKIQAIKCRFLLVKCYLQYAAVESQLVKHEDALEYAKFAKNELKKIGVKLLALAKSGNTEKLDSDLKSYYDSDLTNI